MNSKILSEIPLRINLEHLREKARIKEGSEHFGKLKDVLAEAQAIGKPKAFYRPAFIESRTE